MGNTTSIASNVLIFPPPERSRRGTTYFSGPPLHTSTHPMLTTCLVLLHDARPLYSLLHSLCTDLRPPSDRRRMPGINDDGWHPAAVFHLYGNFGTSNNLLCVLLTKELVQGEGVLGMHCFLHAFEAGHSAQGFVGTLGEREEARWVVRVDGGMRSVDRKVSLDEGVSEEVVVMLEFCAAAALEGYLDGGDDVGIEGWIEGRMMEQLEGVLWGFWLGMDEGVEEDIRKRSWGWADILPTWAGR
ncbi:hypothetical protein HBH47_144810 [Parastagonospora nodorum]|nr:hypothetical protein HBH47_144810 [Parastagonospora nodorum]